MQKKIKVWAGNEEKEMHFLLPHFYKAEEDTDYWVYTGLLSNGKEIKISFYREDEAATIEIWSQAEGLSYTEDIIDGEIKKEEFEEAYTKAQAIIQAQHENIS